VTNVKISPNMIAIKNRAQMYLLERAPLEDPKLQVRVFLDSLTNKELCFYFNELVYEKLDVKLTGMLNNTSTREVMAYYIASYIWPYIQMNSRVMAKLNESETNKKTAGG